MFFSVKLDSVGKHANEEEIRERRLRIIKLSVAGGIILLAIVFGIIFAVVKSSEEPALISPPTESVKAPIEVSHEPTPEPGPFTEPRVEGPTGIFTKALPFVRLHLPVFIISAVVFLLAVVGLVVFLVLRSQQESVLTEIEGPPIGHEGENGKGEDLKVEPESNMTIIIIFSVIGVVVLIAAVVLFWYRDSIFRTSRDTTVVTLMKTYDEKGPGGNGNEAGDTTGVGGGNVEKTEGFETGMSASNVRKTEEKLLSDKLAELKERLDPHLDLHYCSLESSVTYYNVVVVYVKSAHTNEMVPKTLYCENNYGRRDLWHAIFSRESKLDDIESNSSGLLVSKGLKGTIPQYFVMDLGMWNKAKEAEYYKQLSRVVDLNLKYIELEEFKKEVDPFFKA